MTARIISSLDQTKAVLDEVVSGTFESLFFVEANPLASDAVDTISGAEGLKVEIAINSAISGRIAMFLTKETAVRLAGVILGPNEIISNEVLADTFAEILNTIAGRVAAALTQTSFSFDLSIPSVVFGKVQTQDVTSEVRSSYQIDSGCVCISFLYT